MSQISKRGLQSNSVDGSKIQILNNEWVRFRNFANSADINFVKLNTSDEFELNLLPKHSGSQLATENYVTNAISGFQNAFINKGAWDASTNTPTLADGVGTNGWTYRANLAGTVNFGSGNITFQVGDLAVYNGSIWQKFDVIDNELPNSDTDDLAEGATNLYFTDARAKSAAVVNSMAGSETDKAPSVSSVKTFIENQSADIVVETFVLSATNISDGYINLAGEAEDIIEVTPKGFPPQHPVDDYAISVVGGVTRITFTGDMLTLVDGDKLKVAYSI